MLVLLLILIPLVTGLVTFFIKNDNQVRAWTMISSLITLGVSLAGLTVYRDPASMAFRAEWMQGIGSSFSLQLDGVGQILCLLTAVSYPLIFLATWNTAYKKSNNFFALMLLAQAGLMGVFVAMDALLFYFFWELALIPAYFLCSIWGGEKRIQVTFKFFIYTFLGSILMLIGILYVYARTPDHSFDISSFYQTNLSLKQQGVVFWLFFAAFAIKMPVFPLHTWQPDTYEQAPTATTMVLSGIMVKMGLFGIIRWLFPVMTETSYVVGNYITTFAIIGILYASFIAIRQDDLKRLVAYSSIAHVGLMCVGLFTQNTSGLQGVMIQMFNHGINIIGLWIVVEWIERTMGTRKISELGGLAKKAPSLAIFAVIIALANIALPLTNAFPGEFLIFNGILGSRTAFNVWFVVFSGISIILAAVYTLNMIRRVFYGTTNPLTEAATDISWKEKLSLGIITVIIIVMGVFPQPMLDLASGVTDTLISEFQQLNYSNK
jgi:NADH-quinone oxidoreductase subunit M